MAATIVHVEFRSSDFTRTSAFYAKVFDWQTQANGSSTYMKLDADEGPSAGWVRADMTQAPGPLAYVLVEDLAVTLAEVESAGGRILVPRMPFAGGGEIAIFADPDGNVVGLWVRKDRPANGSAKTPATTTAAAAKAAPATAKLASPAKAADGKEPARSDKKAKAAKKR